MFQLSFVNTTELGNDTQSVHVIGNEGDGLNVTLTEPSPCTGACSKEMVKFAGVFEYTQPTFDI
jgi:hypothetical protein